ncbi:MAG: NMD3-related protein [Candidatus Micrarchaeota archaeon]
MSSLICPKCGRSSDNVRFIEAFCIDCYPVKLECPRKMEFEECVRCGKMRIRGEWIEGGKKAISDFIISKCKGAFESGAYDPDTQSAAFIMKESGLEVERTISLEMKRTICQQCSRMSGGYFEGIVQLRGDPLKVRGHAVMFVKRLSRKTFIAKEEEKEGGLDIFVGSSKAVVALLSDLGIKALITKKLVGTSEGKRLYRTTFLLRF